MLPLVNIFSYPQLTRSGFRQIPWAADICDVMADEHRGPLTPSRFDSTHTYKGEVLPQA